MGGAQEVEEEYEEMKKTAGGGRGVSALSGDAEVVGMKKPVACAAGFSLVR
jgi:hypothetical protein